MFGSIYNIAAGALSANRLRINVVASNIANAETTRTEEGGPYKRREVIMTTVTPPRESFASFLEKKELKGVRVAEIHEDENPPRLVYDPAHPDADPVTGNVALPNINPVAEMTNMLTASAAYKAMAEIVGVTKDMATALKGLADK
ncbi:MAG: flagellar basal body rod protein FlgC [Deltaproteobacteria bacterium]|jgi:flagellar basal-body rod protein FlgC|nr:flagellar basal body rod protein FlgC [Deltaproteobacteria bacterium]